MQQSGGLLLAASSMAATLWLNRVRSPAPKKHPLVGCSFFGICTGSNESNAAGRNTLAKELKTSVIVRGAYTVNRINICGTLGNGGEYAVLGEMCFTKSYRLE